MRFEGLSAVYLPPTLPFNWNGFRQCEMPPPNMARDRKGRDFFVRGLPEKYEMVRRVTYTASLLV